MKRWRLESDQISNSNAFISYEQRIELDSAVSSSLQKIKMTVRLKFWAEEKKMSDVWNRYFLITDWRKDRSVTDHWSLTRNEQ